MVGGGRIEMGKEERRKRKGSNVQGFRVKEGEKSGCIATGWKWKGSVFTRVSGGRWYVSAERSIEVER